MSLVISVEIEGNIACIQSPGLPEAKPHDGEEERYRLKITQQRVRMQGKRIRCWGLRLQGTGFEDSG